MTVKVKFFEILGKYEFIIYWYIINQHLECSQCHKLKCIGPQGNFFEDKGTVKRRG